MVNEFCRMAQSFVVDLIRGSSAQQPPSAQNGTEKAEQALGSRQVQVAGVRSQHQRIRPPRTQKWERQPFCSQTDGLSVGLPCASTATSHLGLASATTRSSMTRPQPQGQRMPTDQSSPSSRARTRSRHGMRVGKQSPSTMRSRRGGESRAHARRHHRRIPE